MLKMIMMLALATGAVFAQKAEAKNAAITLPADAKKTGDGTWTHTDSQGREWVYRQMPFGLTRAEKGHVEEFANKAVTLPPGMTAVEQGDTVKFSRQTPFGPVSWTRKADELTDTERAALARARKAKENAAAAKPAAK